MKTMVIIPMKSYKFWLTRCEPTLPEYLWLKNGIIARSGDDREEVQILCDHERVKAIIDFAARSCPEVVSYIKRIANPSF